MNLIPLIKPIGIGDLEVVKQQLDGYEDGEIAHIENIMANEYRKRSHRKLRQLEEFRSFEEDRSTESSNHLESTERFELEKEIQRTIKSETKFEAGVEVSGGFGPVNFSAHAGFSTSSSNEEIQKESSNYAKEIIQKSVEKIKERVKQSKTTRILEEFEERNEHGFDNVGNGHVVGEYKWQNKVYKTKVETLGKRLFYEFIIPQPSMNYLYKESHNSLHLETPIAPSFPKIVREGRFSIDYTKLTFPAQITRSNYYNIKIGRLVVRDLKPPLSERIVVSAIATKELPMSNQLIRSNNTIPHTFVLNGEIEIPEGYQASKYNINYVCDDRIFEGNNGEIVIGDKKISGSENKGDLNPIEKLLYFSITFNYPNYRGFDPPINGPQAISIILELECSIKNVIFQKWQLETYDIVMQEYNRQLMDYEEKMAELEIQESRLIGGKNPLVNKEIIKNEIKYSCIALYLGDEAFQTNILLQDFEQGNSNTSPKIKIDEAIVNAKWIKFFETAFDWKNMSYELYPSFWSTNNVNGTDKNDFSFSRSEIDSLKSEDPLFEQFLKAGSARVLLPATLESSLYLIAINVFGSNILFQDNQDVISMSMIELQEFFEINFSALISEWEDYFEKYSNTMDTQARKDFEKLLNELKMNKGYYAELKPLLPTKDELQIITPIPLPETSEDLPNDSPRVTVPTNLVRLVTTTSNNN